jgi:hypothetical protein
MPPVSARQELKPAQQRALAVLRDGRETELTRGAYQQLAKVSRSQAAYDLAELVETGVLERIGGGRSTRYVLAKHPNLTRRHWTSERIRSELASFCNGNQTWPSAREFKAAGRADLYVAASRYGGVAFWAAELGLDRGGRRWEKPSIARLKLSLSWATIGAVAGAVAVGAAVAIVQGLPHGAGTPAARRAAQSPVPRSTASARKDTASERTSSRLQQRKAAAKATPTKTKVVHVTARRGTSTVRSSAPTTAVLAARTVSSSSPPPPTSTTPKQGRTTTSSTSTSSSSGGPTPLMAPNSSSGTPPPLPAPGGKG